MIITYVWIAVFRVSMLFHIPHIFYDFPFQVGLVVSHFGSRSLLFNSGFYFGQGLHQLFLAGGRSAQGFTAPLAVIS